MATAPALVNQNTLPSAGAFIMKSAAIAPLPPGLLSIMTCAPNSLLKGSAIVRATKSTGPPGGKATNILIGAFCATTILAIALTRDISKVLRIFFKIIFLYLINRI